LISQEVIRLERVAAEMARKAVVRGELA